MRHAGLQKNLHEDSIVGFSSYEDVLPLLLNALTWKGSLQDLAFAKPSGHALRNIQEFRTTLANLGYISQVHIHGNIDHYPILHVAKNGHANVIRHAGEWNGRTEKDGYYISFRQQSAVRTTLSVAGIIGRFRDSLSHTVLFSLLIGAIAVAPVIYNMAVYDTILPTGETGALSMLLSGVLLALGLEVWLRHIRSKTLSHFGARLEHVVSTSVLERLLLLPASFTERSPVASQVARLRDFDAVRDFFTGPLAMLFFELPLVAVYWGIMACIAPKLAIIPGVLIIAYVALLAFAQRRQKEAAKRSANAAAARQEFLLETFSKLRAIRLAGLEDVWSERYENIVKESTAASFSAAFKAQTVEVMSYVLMTLGGVATLGFGVLEVIDETITTGALIASMILIWRVLAPLQMCCASVVRLQQLFASTKQIERLMSLEPEGGTARHTKSLPSLKGNIGFQRVTLRYTGDVDPSLLGVSFDIKPGQVVAIKGENGAGKSSILKLILGLYQPQSGSVRLDGIDIRQFDPVTLRRAIAYVPQHVQLVPGTIRDNLRIADPLATDASCFDALDMACAGDQVRAMPDGLDTVISGDRAETMSFLLLQRLNLARAYLKKAKIMLFDEASHSLGRENDAAFAEFIQRMRGHATIIMATHRMDHMMFADQLLAMHKGELVAAGSPEFVLASLRGKKS